MYLVTSNEMQSIDRTAIDSLGIPGPVLMENAGRGAVEILLNQFNPKSATSFAVISGRGNNGGDGFVMARYLAEKGFKVTVYLLARKEAVKGDAAVNLNLLSSLGVTFIELPEDADMAALKSHQPQIRDHDIIIDAILGTGLNSEVKGYYKAVINFINELEKPVLAVDVPSGLSADTGKPLGACINATATASFAYPKIGHKMYPGRNYTGKLFIVDIGIPKKIADAIAPGQFLLTHRHIRQLFPNRPSDAHKGSTGHLLVIAGSRGKSGAAFMTAQAALRSGAGLVTLGLPYGLNPIAETTLLEAMTVPLPEKTNGALSKNALKQIEESWRDKKAVALGPGIGMDAETGDLVRDIIRLCDKPLVIDADGLNHLADDISILGSRQAPTVLTPHPGEMARLLKTDTSDIQDNRLAYARKLAGSRNVIVVLKGAATVIALPDGTVFINSSGNPGMASGGMGDVLTGLIGGFAVQGTSLDQAARLGVYLHGAAADRLVVQKGPQGYLASDVIDIIPETIRNLLNHLPSASEFTRTRFNDVFISAI